MTFELALVRHVAAQNVEVVTAVAAGFDPASGVAPPGLLVTGGFAERHPTANVANLDDSDKRERMSIPRVIRD